MSSLRVIPPMVVTDAMLISTDVAETDHAEWSGATTYSLGQRVIYQHKIYESLQANNTDHNPASMTSWWLLVSATNRWKCFDLSTSTQTIKTGSMTYTLRPGRIINAVAIINAAAKTARVRMVSESVTVYDTTKSLRGSISDSTWWHYFFGDVDPITDVLFLGMPTYGSADIIIDVDAGTDQAAVGVLALGQLKDLGLKIRYGVELGILDFSRKERDDFGEIQLVQRGFARWAEFPCYLSTRMVDAVIRNLSAVRATPCIWIGTELTTSTIVYGWYRDFSVQVTYPQISDCSIEIEGLI